MTTTNDWGRFNLDKFVCGNLQPSILLGGIFSSCLCKTSKQQETTFKLANCMTRALQAQLNTKDVKIQMGSNCFYHGHSYGVSLVVKALNTMCSYLSVGMTVDALMR